MEIIQDIIESLNRFEIERYKDARERYKDWEFY